ncbi:hypothetical protein HK411_07815 [Calidifontibacter sp. DB2511S]|nr:hypothetical protein [Calidifontibacter sp. DB2511S]
MSDAELTAAQEAQEAGTAVRALTGSLRDAHGALANLGFGIARRYAGPLVTPVEVTHDFIAHNAYGVAGRVLDHGSDLFESAASTLGTRLPASRQVARRLGATSAFVQGLGGDHIANSPMAYRMTLRRSGRDVPVTRAALEQAYPDHAKSLVFFVHGFVGTEQMWKRRAARDDDGRRLSYGRRMEAAGDWSALWVRYNTGQRVSTNGRELGNLIGKVVDAWPEPVERIVLVGHSMGGLVVHSSLLQIPPGARWGELVTDTVTLGTPYHGALLERGVTKLTKEFDRHLATRWAAEILRYRSGGVKDLRHGNLLEDDWAGHDPDDPADWRQVARAHPQHIRHLAIAGTVTGDPHSARSRLLGDLVVSRRSARGLDATKWDSLLLGGVNHMDLLNHPRVYAVLADRLGVEALPLRHPRG